jgi:hypothetical protein
MTAAKTALALVSLEEIPRPESGVSEALLRGLPGVIALVALALWAVLPAWFAKAGGRSARKGGGAAGPPASGSSERPGRDARPVPGAAAREPRIAAFATCWAAVGSIAVFMPSISWHAYYGLFGAFGAWLAIMVALRRRPAIAAALVVALAVLRPLRADTQSWDWASEAFQRRAGYFLRTLRDDLLRKHPDLPSHSRLYFAQVPRNIGWVAGDGPAFRIWYRDSTLEGGYYSYYRPRGPGEPAGRDYFFRFDSTGVWVEVATGPERRAATLRPGWEQDHRELARLLGAAGDWKAAGEELVKLADVSPENYEYPLNAAVCY